MVYISIDYVFDGQGEKQFEVINKPYSFNNYGKTQYKWELEIQSLSEKYFIIRIFWIFELNGNDFVKAVFELGKERDKFNVFAGQTGPHTST